MKHTAWYVLLAASVLLLTAAAGSSFAAVLFVDAGAAGSNDGSSWPDAFTNLQSALSAAQPGDEIWVRAGTYRPGVPGDVDATFALPGGVGLYGGFAGGEISRLQRDPAAHPTILSGDLGADDVYGVPVWYSGWNINTPNSKHVVTVGGGAGPPVLDGFTIIAGYSTFGGGAGLLINSGNPSITRCTITRNLAGFSSGGAVQVLAGHPTFTDCTFLQNYVHLGKGAAVDMEGSCNATFAGCSFRENILFGTPSGGEGAGGAINTYSSGTLTVSDCEFLYNQAANFWPSGDNGGTYGGAIHNLFGNLIVDRCTFIGNFSNNGGAIWSWRSATVRNSLFHDNDAPEYHAAQGGWGGTGGAIGGYAFQAMEIKVYGCTIVANSAEAGGGLRVSNTMAADVRHCILWGNSDRFGSIGPSQIKGTGASHSDIQNMLIGEPGEDPPDPADFPGCFDDDPQFVAAFANLRLQPSSPCINAGEPGYTGPAGERDLDGHGRILCSRVDVGAYEFGFADYDCNRIVDLSDFSSWPACLTGPQGGPYPPGCEAFDVEYDSDVDLADFGGFQRELP